MLRHAALIFALLATPLAAQTTGLLRAPTAEVKAEVVVTGLEEPWGMAFLPDGSILVTEKPGTVRRIVGDQVSAPFTGLPKIVDWGQGGLLDIALDPDFEDTGRIFFSFSEPGSLFQGASTAVARATLNLDAGRLDDVAVIFSANEKSRGGRHFGSRIRFAPDKTMFVTLGDRGTQMRAQNPMDHAGCVIRIDRDGNAPADNPFVAGGALPEIWSTGHRNPQGAAIHPDTGEIWTLSHGAAGGDEINRPEAGKNYGWPLISYGSNYSGFGFEKGDAAEGLEQPVYHWDPSIAPSGLDFYAPSEPLIPAWDGALLAGALKYQLLSVLFIEDGAVVAEEQYFEEEFGRIRDVRTGPDGAVWLLTDDDDGALVRITGG